MKDNLLGKTLLEFKQICETLSLPKYTAMQLADWLYKKRVDSYASMTNISKESRALLSQHYEIGRIKYSLCAESKDGTKKYLFKKASNSHENNNEEKFIESVVIPDSERLTLCLSSQRGCRMGCRFCMTGRQGFFGNLDSSEMINQFLSVDNADNMTNAVFMGMGEPMDNFCNVLKTTEILTSEWGFGWSPKRITISTIGVNVAELLDKTKVHIAISMHNPFSSERLAIMPSERKYPIESTIELLKQYDFSGQRRVSLEYIMFDNLNDSKRHADAIIRMLKGLECRVNLIRFHDIRNTNFRKSKEIVIERFKERLNSAGITTTIRASKGEDIDAACGMLSGKYQVAEVRSQIP